MLRRNICAEHNFLTNVNLHQNEELTSNTKYKCKLIDKKIMFIQLPTNENHYSFQRLAKLNTLVSKRYFTNPKFNTITNIVYAWICIIIALFLRFRSIVSSTTWVLGSTINKWTTQVALKVVIKLVETMFMRSQQSYIPQYYTWIKWYPHFSL